MLAVGWVEFLRLAEPRSPPPPHAAGCNFAELVALSAGGELLQSKGLLYEPPGNFQGGCKAPLNVLFAYFLSHHRKK